MALSNAQFRERIEKAKQNADIKAVIESTGAQPVYANTAKGEYTYHAPYRSDSNPSLTINIHDQTFCDFGLTGSNGDVIELTRRIFGKGDANAMPFFEAVKWLERFSGVSVAPQAYKQTQQPKKQPVAVSHEGDRFTFVKAAPVTAKTHPNNLDYIANTRKIGLAVASRHLHIITYRDNAAPLEAPLGQQRYGIGAQNDAGGWEVRSTGGSFKTSLGPKDVTTYAGNKGATVGDIFEGRFDFLTRLEIAGLTQPENPTVILNSGRLATRAAEVIKSRPDWQMVKLWLIWQQNDDEGDRSTQAFIEALGEGYTVGTLNHYWQGYNDLNQWWTEAQPTDQRNTLAVLKSNVQPMKKFYDTSATAEARRSHDERVKNNQMKLF